jgi:DNA-binding transcriptional ArsR family regulator
MNMKNTRAIERISKLLDELAAPMRLAILLSIGEQEACVCHLEATLKKRQAYISQHLMALRNAGMIRARREGRFVYYRLVNPDLLGLIRDAAQLAGVDFSLVFTPKGCDCPNCESGKPPRLILVNQTSR